MKEPCRTCPFLVKNRHILTKKRINEIVDAITHDFTFDCHSTLDYSEGEPVKTKDTQLCFGSALFLENAVEGGMYSNWRYRLGLRFKEFLPSDIRQDDAVYGSRKELLKSAIDAKRRRR